jgi:hypothetical protein
MLVGHVAVGFAAKPLTPRTSLGTLVLAALLVDLLWGVFMIVGIEHVQFVTRGPTLMTSVGIYDISYSHSLAATAIWGALFAAACLLRTRDRRAAWIVFAAVLSHWLLDWISHGRDMSLAPGIHRYYGLGLWNSIGATLLVEGLFWALAVAIYIRGTRALTRAGLYALWIGIVLLTAAWYNNIAGPPPPGSSRSIGVSSLVFFSIVTAWASWMNRLRRSTTGTPDAAARAT